MPSVSVNGAPGSIQSGPLTVAETAGFVERTMSAVALLFCGFGSGVEAAIDAVHVDVPAVAGSVTCSAYIFCLLGSTSPNGHWSPPHGANVCFGGGCPSRRIVTMTSCATSGPALSTTMRTVDNTPGRVGLPEVTRRIEMSAESANAAVAMRESAKTTFRT